jgi:hypothetical protein
METNLKDMTDLYTCPNCSRSYRADKLAECPRCFARGPGVVDEKRVSAKNWAGLMNSASSDYSGSTLIVAAQDRTTHAIRSLAIFVLVSISTALIGYIIIEINSGSSITYILRYEELTYPGKDKVRFTKAVVRNVGVKHSTDSKSCDKVARVFISFPHTHAISDSRKLSAKTLTLRPPLLKTSDGSTEVKVTGIS